MNKILYTLCMIGMLGLSCKHFSRKGKVSVTENDSIIAIDDDPGMSLRPTNEFVLSRIPVTAVEQAGKTIRVEALGNITYDTRFLQTIASRTSGRIEKLWVRYRFQKIVKGQKLMEVYSPELLTAEENLLFLLKNDPENIQLIAAAKERLLLLGMNQRELSELLQNRTILRNIPVYSEYNGHIHEAISKGPMNAPNSGMKDIALLTEELTLKEGMYLQKGQPVFSVYDPAKAWAILSVFGEHQSLVKIGSEVQFYSETSPEKKISTKIDFIEPFYRKEDKTLTARVFFDNSRVKIPIGSQVKASIAAHISDAAWLPESAVLSRGLDKVAFIREGEGFKAIPIRTGLVQEGKIQVLHGLAANDSVAVHANYLMDSESFIKIKK